MDDDRAGGQLLVEDHSSSMMDLIDSFSNAAGRLRVGWYRRWFRQRCGRDLAGRRLYGKMLLVKLPGENLWLRFWVWAYVRRAGVNLTEDPWVICCR